MTVTRIDEWRLPGCTSACWPRSHDPFAHEQYGRELERETQRRSIVMTGPLVVDLTAETVTVAGEDIHLSGREWGMLAYLAARPGEWCSSEDILAAAWGPEWVNGLTVQTRTKRYRQDIHNVAIRSYWLRRKLGPAGVLIETQRGGRAMRRLRIEEPPPCAS